MARRTICNYANASKETPVKSALYQRGQFYIEEMNKRKGDRRRYRVMINDSLLGFGGSLVRVKRFVNTMYKTFPFATDVSDEMADEVRKFGKQAQMDIRPQFKPNKAKPKPKNKKVPGPKTKQKPKAKTQSKKRALTGKELAFQQEIERVDPITKRYMLAGAAIVAQQKDIAKSNTFSIADFNKAIRLQKEIIAVGKEKVIRRDFLAEQKRVNEQNLTNMMTKMGLDVLPTDEIVSLDELRSKRKARKIKDERPTITARNLKALINKVFQCDLTAAEGLAELEDFKATKAVINAKDTIKGVKCRAESAEPTNNKTLSKAQLKELREKIQATKDPKILRPIILDLSLKTVRTRPVEDLIKLARRRVKR